MHRLLPNHLRRRREKIFRPAPEYRLDGNAKARVWAAATAYNAPNCRPGPLTWATLRVLRALLWRFHGADGGGRCSPSFEKIAAAAKCCRDSVNVAIKALEEAVNRITRRRRREWRHASIHDFDCDRREMSTQRTQPQSPGDAELAAADPRR